MFKFNKTTSSFLAIISLSCALTMHGNGGYLETRPSLIIGEYTFTLT